MQTLYSKARYMIALGRNSRGASLETLSYTLRTIVNTFPNDCLVRRAADDILRNIEIKRLSGIEYTEQDAIIIIASRASLKLIEAQCSIPRNLEVEKFFRSFIESAMGRVLPCVKPAEIYYTIRSFFGEDPLPPPREAMLEGFCYGAVLNSMYGDIRGDIRLCGIDEFREIVLAHVDVITTRPGLSLTYQKIIIHAYARVLGAFH